MSSRNGSCPSYQMPNKREEAHRTSESEWEREPSYGAKIPREVGSYYRRVAITTCKKSLLRGFFVHSHFGHVDVPAICYLNKTWW